MDDESMDAVPIDFTLTTQTPQRVTYAPGNALLASTGPTTSPAPASACNEQLRDHNMYWAHVAGAMELDGAGDTQPLDSQIFRAHSDIILSKSVIAGNKAIANEVQIAIADSELAAQDGQEFDLTDDGEDVAEEDDDLSSLNRTDEPSPATNARISAETKALFKLPQTPLLGNRKRNRQGELISSEYRTSSTKAPGSELKRMFGAASGPNALNMTQLFQQTQVYSSPPPAGPHSDTVFDRPSPGMQLRQSSPRHMTLSSPIRPSTSDGIGKDPLSVYRTMQESQESRTRRLRREREQEQRMLDNLGEDDFDDSIGELHKRHIWHREKNFVISNVELKAPGLKRMPRDARSKSVDHLSSERNPITPASKLFKVQPMSPDPVSDTVEQLDLPDTVQEHDVQEDATGVQVPMTSSKPLRSLQSRPSQQPSPSSSQRTEERDAPTQLSIAVQDSQGDCHMEPKDGLPLPITGPSSAVSGHRIAQSQYSILTSDTRALLSQQLRTEAQQGPIAAPPPQAVHTSYHEDREEEEEAIRSSPPLFSEHDHEFDDNESDVEVVEDDEQIAEDAGVGVAPEGADPEDEKSAEDADMDEVDLLPEPSHIHLARPETDITLFKTRDGTEHDSRKPSEMPRTSHAVHVEGAEHVLHEQTASATTGSEKFDTALSRQTPSPSRGVQQPAENEKESQISPIRRFADIAGVPSPRRSGESCDLDSVIHNMFSDGDRNFMEVMDGSDPVRPAKRVRVYSGKRSILREPSLNANLPRASKIPKEPSGKEITENGKPLSSGTSAPLAPPRQLGVVFESSTPDTAEAAPKEKVNSMANVLLDSRTRGATRQQPSSVKGQLKGSKIGTDLRKRLKNVRGNSASSTPIVGAKEATSTPKPPVTDGNRLATSPLRSTDSDVLQPYDDVVNNSARSAAPRVLALFKDAKRYYYPATYIETILPENEKHKVQFCDGTVDIVESMHIRHFELRINDCVKFNLDGMRKGTYLIQGFADYPDHDPSNNMFSDAAGHKTVKVLPKTADGFLQNSEPIMVAVEHIYLTGVMLPIFADRKFAPPSKDSTRLSTPALQESEPTTPGSRTRRQLFNTSMHGDYIASSGLFSNMLFAVTFVNDHDQSKYKDNVVKQILGNGGALLDHGFDELFEPDVSAPFSPSKSPSSSKKAEEIAKEPLRLRPGAQHLGFVALLADRHCRKEKWLQALALGIPCLHYRWITDCIARSTMLPFECYLLPAGESEYLSGALRSRNLIPYGPSSKEAALQQVLQRRSIPFKDASVLLVTSSADRRKAYRFLARAAGAISVQCSHNVNEAKKCMDAGSKYDWLLCDGDKAKAREILLNGKHETHKKRKRNSGGKESSLLRETKVADSEFLVQSLILGTLVDV